ncbi:TIGR02678 family protein [Streptomyces sp. NPDC021212]|uniref:TIGR02678 family protein n=1 Tax=Streptomyces sp. NPDC021212 TaxID=3365118 RepID=UPI0037A99AD8
MSSLVSATTAAHDALERRQAARLLLASPVLTAHRNPGELALVRRHAPALRSVFSRMLGYQLVVESSFARLVKVPVRGDAPARHSSGTGFTPQIRALFCLACAALLAPGTGEQILISSFIEQIRADAAAAGVALDDSRSQRRYLVTAIGLLIEWGVLTETDGTLAGWSERHEEALLSIHRPLLPHLLARPLGCVERLEDLWTPPGPESDEPRRSLRRKLVENPLVRREQLSESERDVLSRERSDLTRLLEEHFGLVLEVRAEGTLAYASDGPASDIEFPGPGTVRQAALLLIDVLLQHRSESTLPTGPEPSLRCTWSEVDAALQELAAAHAKAWSSLYTSDPDRLRSDVMRLLLAMSLAEADDEGLLLHPVAARYRPVVRAGTPTRAAARLNTDSPAPATLFKDTWTTATETAS